ncbi:hypothetical protein GCM10027085_52770 [Spirosoma aerophilum]
MRERNRLPIFIAEVGRSRSQSPGGLSILVTLHMALNHWKWDVSFEKPPPFIQGKPFSEQVIRGWGLPISNQADATN